MKRILILLAALFLVSCSLDNQFLKPHKIPVEKKELNFKGANGPIRIAIGDKFQPTFYRNDSEAVDLGFELESVVFESESGNLLNGWFLKPRDQKPSITLLHFHGNAGSLFSQFQAISKLLDYGFQIFMFDYSGFGYSEGKGSRKNVLLDGNSALAYIKNRDEVKETKLIIYGQSLGGHLAAVVAAENEDDIDGLVIEGAFSSHKDIAAEHFGFLGRTFVREMYSAKRSIGNYHKPLLIIHSSEDAVIPLKFGKLIYDAGNEPKEFYEIKHNHITGPKHYTKEIAAKLKSMVE